MTARKRPAPPDRPISQITSYALDAQQFTGIDPTSTINNEAVVVIGDLFSSEAP
jgi:hypothetical protein